MKIYNTLKNKIFDRLWFKITCFLQYAAVYIYVYSLSRIHELPLGKTCFSALGQASRLADFGFYRDGDDIRHFAAACKAALDLRNRYGRSHADNRDNKLRKAGGKRRLFFPVGYINGKKIWGSSSALPAFDLPPYLWLFIPAFVIACVLYALSGAEIPVHWYCRVPLAAAVFAVFAVYYSEPKVTETLLNKFNMSFNDSVLQASNYTANGFVDAFAINCMAMNVSEPEGYSQQKIESYLEDYEGLIPSGPVRYNSPDVIVILSEAFFDITTLKGTTFRRSRCPISRQ